MRNGPLIRSSRRERKTQPVNPVRYVKCSVRSEGEQVVSRDVFRFARALEHEQLREDRDRFEVDRKGPEDLERVTGQNVRGWGIQLVPNLSFEHT